MTIDAITVRREVEVVVTPQAQKVLQATDYTIEEFVDWCLESRKISYGGHNVTSFLEAMWSDE